MFIYLTLQAKVRGAERHMLADTFSVIRMYDVSDPSLTCRST